MLTLINFIFKKIVPSSFWYVLITFICLSAIVGYFSGILAGLFAFLSAVPIIIVSFLILTLWELGKFKKELVALGHTVSYESLIDEDKRGDIIISICNLAGCDSKNPLIANYVIAVLLKSKEQAVQKLAQHSVKSEEPSNVS